jgi:hypothetical protein
VQVLAVADDDRGSSHLADLSISLPPI